MELSKLPMVEQELKLAQQPTIKAQRTAVPKEKFT